MGRADTAAGGPECTAGDQLAGELRALRGRTGRSLKELQDLVHASDSSLSRYLSGRIVPPWPVVDRLCELAREDPAGPRALWEHVQSERHRTGRCVPVPRLGQELEPETEPEPEPEPRAVAWYRRHPALAVAALVTATALVSGGLGIWGGLQLAPRRPRTALIAQQDSACRNWPWPTTSSAAGQVVVPPVRLRGIGHTPTVQLRTGTLNGSEVAWARITGARYGDRVWMDWSTNGGKTWTQCGPFTATTASRTTHAHVIGPGWHFRACGDAPRPAGVQIPDRCTAFW
jgi:transcriptional regulator with XRE-family HTH domain